MAKFLGSLLFGGATAPAKSSEPVWAQHRLGSIVLNGALLTIVYFASAKLGLLLAAVHPNATPVWPPAGIALAALLVAGPEVWPGIFAGAFLVNLATAGSIASSLGIAAGNTLEGILAALLIDRFASGWNAFDRPQGVFKFALFGGLASTMVSASIGLTSLAAAGYAPAADWLSIWVTWWMGDAGGVLIVAPVLILWATDSHVRWRRDRLLEAALLLMLLCLNGYAVFGGLLPVTANTYPLAFLCIPILVWIGLRFGQRETATAHLLLSGIAVLGTLSGHGPFARENPNESLLLLQAFMGVIGVMALALAAGVSEHKRAEANVRKLNAELESRVLERTLTLYERNAMLLDANKKLTEESAERRRAREQTRYNLERLQALGEIGFAMASTLDLGSILAILMSKVDLLLPYSAAAIKLVDPATGELEPAICRNLKERAWRSESWEFEREVGERVLETRSPLVLRNIRAHASKESNALEFEDRLVSFLGVPLIADSEVLGVLSVYTNEEHDFGREEVDFLIALAHQAAVTIRHAQMFEKSRKQATRLEKASRVKDEFLSVMSHELRTPLMGVMGYTGMMKDGMLGEINPEQHKALGKVINRANDLLGIVNSILHVTELQADEVKVHWEAVDLTAFLDRLQAFFYLPAGKNIDVRWDYPSRLPAVRTDAFKLRTVLENLLANAVKFTEQGEVRLRVRPMPQRRAVSFAVSDTGVGVPRGEISRIFEKFKQVDSSETRNYGGIGLGLHVVKQLAGLLQAKIEVESEVGKGSTFTVTIPWASDAPGGGRGD